MNSKTTILIADDHLVVRMGLATIIGLEKDLVVAGEAKDGAEAVRLAGELKPDVIVMDLMMPKKNGVDATVEILRENPSAKILVLTTFGTSQDIIKVMEAGARGALVKTSSQTEIIAAIRTIAAGGHVMSDEIKSAIKTASTAPRLSSRQLEVLNLVAKGFSNHDVARILGIGVNGVKDHLKNIYALLDVSSRTEAASVAINLHLITG